MQQIDPERFEDLRRRVNGVPERVARIEEQVTNLGHDMEELNATQKALVLQLEHREREAAKERKADRRVQIGIFCTVLTTLLAAATLLVSQL